jgi:hypothetical protein
MQKSVVIDYLPENARRYQSGWAIVAVEILVHNRPELERIASAALCPASRFWM